MSPWNGLPMRIYQAPNVKCFERRLDRYWSKFNLKYNFDNCVKYEKENMYPTNPGNLEVYDEDDDLDLQGP